MIPFRSIDCVGPPDKGRKSILSFNLNRPSQLMSRNRSVISGLHMVITLIYRPTNPVTEKRQLLKRGDVSLAVQKVDLLVQIEGLRASLKKSNISCENSGS
jgi:hypothetical protein